MILRRVARAWEEAAAGLGIRATPETVADLVTRYGEVHRRYHDLNHVHACVARFDEHRDLAERPAEVLAALLFHDAVYDPRRSDNEARSAALARAALLGAPPEAVDRIAAMIAATAGHVARAADDIGLVLDIDLSILGAPPDIYDAFERGVREEYGFVDDEAFRAGRSAMLRDFLARPALYVHPPLRDAFEVAARRNLARAVAALA